MGLGRGDIRATLSYLSSERVHMEEIKKQCENKFNLSGTIWD